MFYFFGLVGLGLIGFRGDAGVDGDGHDGSAD